MQKRMLALITALLLCGLTGCGRAQPAQTAASGETSATAAARPVTFKRFLRVALTPQDGPLPQVLRADSEDAFSQAAAWLITQAEDETQINALYAAFAQASRRLLDTGFFAANHLLLILTEEGSTAADYCDAAFENGTVTILREGSDPLEDGLQTWLTLLAIPAGSAPADPAKIRVAVRDAEAARTTVPELAPQANRAAAPTPRTLSAEETPAATFVEETTQTTHLPADTGANFVRVYPFDSGDDGWNGSVTVIRSHTALEQYYQTNRDTLGLGSKTPNAVNPDSGATQPPDSTAGFADWMPHYDDAFFADHALLLVRTREGSGSIRYRDAQFVNGAVRISAVRPAVGTADMAYWITLLPVDAAALTGVDADAIPVKKTTVNV